MRSNLFSPALSLFARCCIAATLVCGRGVAAAEPETAACPSTAPAISAGSAHGLGVGADSPVDIQADRVELDGDTAVFVGNVIVQYGAETLYADRARYNKNTDQIQASGNVRLRNASGDALETPFLEIVRETGTGYTQAVTFQFAQNGSRGEARRIYFHGRELVRLEGSRYTRCPRGQDDWFIVASDIELDYDRDVGTARHARIKFKHVPIFYWPYMTFPLSDQRKSGFLAPVFGTDTKNGFFFAAPYYFNIAPDLDATVTPRVLSKRGLLWQTEARYLGRESRYDGVLNVDYLAKDRLRDINRSLAKLQHHHYFNTRWVADIDLNSVSDQNYFEDFSVNVADAATTHIPQKIELRYADETWRGLGRLFRYQTLDPTGIAGVPYSRLPEILITGDTPTGPNRLRYRLDADLANFEHPAKVSGQRFGLFPSVSLPLQNSFAHAIPKVGARYVAYQIADGTPEAPSEVIPVSSLDLGLAFERSVSLGDTNHVQTLEPRLFYAYIPYRNQDELPNFDTGPQDFNYSNLFRENRFFGGDRVGDTNQLTAGITSRLMDDRGAEWLRASVGEVFYFEPRRVLTPEQQLAVTAGYAGAERSLLVTQLRARVSPTVYVRNDLQWDDRRSRTIKSSSFVHYRPRPDRIVNLGHRYVNNPATPTPGLEQVELSTQWPVSQRWTALAKQSYSLIDNSYLESFVGFQYNACCWLGRLYVQRRVTQELGVSNLYYFEFELSGLLKLGVAPIPSPLAAGSFIFD